jgi:hypothetical protein
MTSRFQPVSVGTVPSARIQKKGMSALRMARDSWPVASAFAGQAEWNAIFNLALAAADPAWGVIIVPGTR